jgi:alpha-mannosidase
MEAELKFALCLCDLHPESSGQWKPLIERAEEAARAAAASADLNAINLAMVEMELVLSPLTPVAKQYTIHVVGHGHIDMNWMWSWPETVSITVDTVSTVLRLMDEYPEFCYSQSQCSIYEILENHRPDLLKRVARRVREGRWEVTASHWVEADRNMACAESLCRHVLYSRRYIRRLFRLNPEDVPTDWSPDTFGHPATVPVYLSRAAVKYLYMHRPGTHTVPKAWLFWWEGPDGSRVLVRNDSNAGAAYNGSVTPDMIRDWAAFSKETGLRDFMFIYGVGDHGGGPTRRDIEFGIEMNQWPVFPNVRFSTARAFFEKASEAGARLPVHRGELNFEFAGCYTSQSLIKKANRFGENRVSDAETAAALTAAAGLGRYDTERFERAWRNVLFNHFHDILPGSGVMDTRTYSHGLYQQTMAATSQMESAALQALASAVPTSGLLPDGAGAAIPVSRLRSSLGSGVGKGSNDGGISHADRGAGEGDRPIVLFNPTAVDRREIVEAHVWEGGQVHATPMKDRRYQVRWPDGVVSQAQVTGGGRYWGHNFATVAFPATVPAFGYAACAIVEEGQEQGLELPKDRQARWTGEVHHCGYSLCERPSEGLENEFIRVELDPVTGGIRRLLEKAGGTELVRVQGRAPALEYEVERPHGMSAWLIQHPGAPAEAPLLKALRRGLKGPYVASLEADLLIHESTLTVVYEVRAGDPKLYIRISGTWFQRGTPQTGVPALSFALPLALQEAQARYEIPFGAIDRALNRREEVPALQWAQVNGRIGETEAGCLLLNDCKYGHSLEGSILRLTLIRGSYEPDILPEIGRHEINLAVRPFAGRLPVETAIAEGQSFNKPLRLMSTDRHEGKLPLRGRFLRITPASATISGIKQAEDGKRLVVRLFNPTDTHITAKLHFGDKELLPAPVSAVELDLMERPIRRTGVKVRKRVVSAPIAPHGILTLSLDIPGGFSPRKT